MDVNYKPIYILSIAIYIYIISCGPKKVLHSDLFLHNYQSIHVAHAPAGPFGPSPDLLALPGVSVLSSPACPRGRCEGRKATVRRSQLEEKDWMECIE